MIRLVHLVLQHRHSQYIPVPTVLFGQYAIIQMWIALLLVIQDLMHLVLLTYQGYPWFRIVTGSASSDPFTAKIYSTNRTIT